jgi:hypothetical protein
MEIDQQALTFLIGILTILSFIFTWWNAIKKPQIKSEVEDAKFNEKFKGLESIVLNMRDNHLHTLEVKIDKHIEENQRDCIDQTKQLSRIETLLEQLMKK